MTQNHLLFLQYPLAAHPGEGRGGPMPYPADRRGERGAVMFYIFLAISLLASLTFFFTNNTDTNTDAQSANRIAQELFAQSSVIRSAAVECTLKHPEGGGDIHPAGAPDGDIDYEDNPNPPFPLSPSSAVNNAVVDAGDNTTSYATDDARYISCLYDDDGTTRKQSVFQGSGSQGRTLPPPPTGWPEWQYTNVDTDGDKSDAADGVSISIVPPSGGIAAANILATKFNLTLCQATWTGSGTFTIWIEKATCP
jgi:hypothetical protein